MRGRRTRPDPGLLLAGLGGLFLLPVLFTSWFCLPSGSLAAEGAIAVAPRRCYSAWTSFGVLDLVLLAVALAAIASALMTLMRVSLPFPPGRLLAATAGGAFLLVLFRLASPPWTGGGRASGPFLGLLCLAGIAAGGMVSGRIIAAAGTRARNRGGRPPVRRERRAPAGRTAMPERSRDHNRREKVR